MSLRRSLRDPAAGSPLCRNLVSSEVGVITKKAAAMRALGIAWTIHHEKAGDEEAESLILQLLWLAEDLDPAILYHHTYGELLEGGDSRRAKLRRLIDHPTTPQPERDAALRALRRSA